MCHFDGESNTMFAFGGATDLWIYDECNDSENNYSSLGCTYRPPEGLEPHSEGAQAFLGGRYEFKVLELEVFKVYFMK